MKRTADSSTTSGACPKSTSHGRRASGIASGSIHTAITPSTPRRYGNGGSHSHERLGHFSYLMSARPGDKHLGEPFCNEQFLSAITRLEPTLDSVLAE